MNEKEQARLLIKAVSLSVLYVMSYNASSSFIWVISSISFFFFIYRWIVKPLRSKDNE